MSKKEQERIKELEIVNALWQSSYKKLQKEYDELAIINAALDNNLHKANSERKLWFDKSLQKTEMLDTVYDAVKHYRNNEHLYGVENGTMQGWYNS